MVPAKAGSSSGAMAARTPRAAAAAAASILSPTPRALGSTGTPVLAECPGNDDELERRQRRRSRAVDSSLQGLGSPSLRYGQCAGPGLRGERGHRPRRGQRGHRHC